jgi:hypothetical protein
MKYVVASAVKHTLNDGPPMIRFSTNGHADPIEGYPSLRAKQKSRS